MKGCQCCVSLDNYKDSVTPSCSNQDVLGICTCANFTTTVGKTKVTTQRCNCTGELRSDRGISLTNNQNLNVSAQSCGSNITEAGVTYQRCCVRENVFAAAPARQCRVADQLNATCTFFNNAVQNASSAQRSGYCTVRQNQTTYYFDQIAVNSSDCSCNDLTL
jgi:hypothetical protein